MVNVMQTKDAMSSREGLLYITIDNQTYEFAEILKFKAEIEYNKVEVKRLNARMEGSKIVGAKGTGEMTVYYHRPEIRAMAMEYLRSGKSPMFDANVVNADVTSAAGKQTVDVRNIVPNKTLLAMLDAESADTLKDEFSFTFDDFNLINQFNVIQ
ncbi:phage tail tube protein [Metasolibacillus meyeri]|uniref:phage tail tube protein n=1 Tax=Metasolibacillus meyeri TaxID=1071052 RepID=UPI000D30FAA7|nr:phage tail tube protein [Metasolibacillus meyeri]